MGGNLVSVGRLLKLAGGKGVVGGLRRVSGCYLGLFLGRRRGSF